MGLTKLYSFQRLWGEMGLFLQSTGGLDVLGERKNERLELVKNLGSENKQNVTTIRVVFYPGGP